MPEDQAALGAQKVVGFVSPPQAKRNAARQKKAFLELEKARLAAKLGTLAELAARQPKLAQKVKDYERWAADQRAIAAGERRLICEGFLPEPAVCHTTPPCRAPSGPRCCSRESKARMPKNCG